MIYLRDTLYTGKKVQSNYDTCASEYCSKLRNKGIDGMHVGVELLYEHDGTPNGFLIERFPTPRAKCTKKRSVWKIKQNDLVF